MPVTGRVKERPAGLQGTGQPGDLGESPGFFASHSPHTRREGARLGDVTLADAGCGALSAVARCPRALPHAAPREAGRSLGAIGFLFLFSSSGNLEPKKEFRTFLIFR